jgi:hypothetical protein
VSVSVGALFALKARTQDRSTEEPDLNQGTGSFFIFHGRKGEKHGKPLHQRKGPMPGAGRMPNVNPMRNIHELQIPDSPRSGNIIKKGR